MRVRKKFLQLTKRTYPHGTENELTFFLPSGYTEDEHGNYFIKVGESKTMFTCHLDTASVNTVSIKHKFEGHLIKTDGNSILGADDKAGMTVLLYMIENKVPGLYYFFIGEEVGCVGSGKSSVSFALDHPYINKVISFDRRGTTSIITHQSMIRCCSDEFAEELSNRLNNAGFGLKLSPDDTGGMTDSSQFMDIVPECTNISVGYYNEHKKNECQDIFYLALLCKSVTLIDWETLPVSRDPLVDEYYGEYYNEYGELIEAEAEEEEEFSYIYHTYINGVKTFISNNWISSERNQLYDLLKAQGYSPNSIYWDGNTCYLEEDNIMAFIGTRKELLYLLPSLSRIPSKHIKTEL